MNKPSPAPEPSMEEILASIRRIISDGEDPATQPDALARVEDEDDTPAIENEDDGESEEEDILDLTEEMFVGKPAAGPAEAPQESESDAEGDISVGGSVDPDVIFDDADSAAPPAAADLPAQEPESAARPQTAARSEPSPETARAEFFVFGGAGPAGPQARRESEEALMSPATDATVAAAFGRLANDMLTHDSRTIEDLVADLLRPMLREWLDDNLPALVERLIRAEIERVSRGRP